MRNTSLRSISSPVLLLALAFFLQLVQQQFLGANALQLQLRRRVDPLRRTGLVDSSLDYESWDSDDPLTARLKAQLRNFKPIVLHDQNLNQEHGREREEAIPVEAQPVQVQPQEQVQQGAQEDVDFVPDEQEMAEMTAALQKFMALKPRFTSDHAWIAQFNANANADADADVEEAVVDVVRKVEELEQEPYWTRGDQISEFSQRLWEVQEGLSERLSPSLETMAEMFRAVSPSSSATSATSPSSSGCFGR